jgi:hypothetical protein
LLCHLIFLLKERVNECADKKEKEKVITLLKYEREIRDI